MRQLVRSFGKIGLLSFGGPAAQIALMHDELVERRTWLSEQQFLRSLSFCMLLPGPEAMQLATYVGWRLRGIAGGVIAGSLFVLPGALVIAVLALLYARYGAAPQAQAMLLGVKACVVVIVARALLQMSKKALRGWEDRALALAGFLALYAADLPFPLVIGLAMLWGALRSRPAAEASAPPPAARVTPWPVLLGWAGLWLLPLPVLYLMGQSLLFDLAMFFARLAVVTFGGAYAVLAYMAQEVVEARAWLAPAQMVDALGLAETTPGPLILVTQFVGMLVGHTAGGVGLALIAGALTLWMTFVPCFLWIFAGAPYVETLLARPRLQSALAAVTAAVVGVIANLSLWFALHLLFDKVIDTGLGPMPALSSLNPAPLPLIAVAGFVLLSRQGSVPIALALCAGLGWLGSLV
ncbi:chromate efflux transporter [Tropicibacter oceani]|uniref:Chromate efflux transporter n=1 Tax=Tropicibacter oceani TaxID=3058420 RepID=A0ABY8QFE2_9RHOB|nr:chromate efflux transporter [Tropicibacter oceani]WGW02736.1 chromate efflux transporter [Tropicibacter oceani]